LFDEDIEKDFFLSSSFIRYLPSTNICITVPQAMTQTAETPEMNEN